MFEWPRHPRAVLEPDRDWRERQIFEWIFARKLVKVGFVIACPMPTVMRPTWVFADRAASEASGETVLNQNEPTAWTPHPRALGCENMRGAAVTARLASYVTRLTRGGGTGTGTGTGVGAGTARAGQTPIDRRAFSTTTTMGGAPYVPPHRRGSTITSASASNASANDKTDKKILHLVRHGRTEMNEYLAANRWDGTFILISTRAIRLTNDVFCLQRPTSSIRSSTTPD